MDAGPVPDRGSVLGLIDIERELGLRSLADFVRMAWPHVEPRPLVWSWHMDAVCEHLQLVTDGQIKNLVICIPPGMSKSLIASTLWPAWQWTRDPTIKFLTAAYAQKISEKSAKLHRDLVLSQWFRERWPGVEIGKDSAKLKSKFETTAGGFRFSTSVKGAATGEHADVIIGDDLAKAQDAEGRSGIDAAAIKAGNQFWFGALATRNTNIQTTRRVLIMQRLHYEDAAGIAIDEGYVPLVLPMRYDPERKCVIDIPIYDAPIGTSDRKEIGRHHFEDPRTKDGELLCHARYPEDEVRELEKTLGPSAAAAQLQQTPSQRGGAIFRSSFWRSDDGQPVNRWSKLPTGLRKIVTVDCTFKTHNQSDWVVIQVWGVRRNRYYLIDEKRGRWSVLQTAAKVLLTKVEHPTATGVYVEDKANGPAVVQVLKDKISGLREWSPGRSPKEERAEAAAALMDAGDVLFPRDEDAPWLEAYFQELVRFPFTNHDDRVDATSMALLILHHSRQRRVREAYEAMSRGKVL